MAAVQSHPFSCWEDTSPALMARVTGNSAANITQASLSAINLYVYRKPALTTDLASGAALTISSVVFDTLQTDSRWTEDSTGYNFRYDLATTYTASPGNYRVEIKFTPSSGAAFFVVWEGEVKAVQAS